MSTTTFAIPFTKPQVLSIVSTKGGEGKSTLAGNVAGITADAGLKTLLIDGDQAQPTVSSMYRLKSEAPYGLYELLLQATDLNHPEQIISQTEIENLDLIISNDPHDQLKTVMLHAPDGRMRLRNVLQHPLFSEYDVIVIDSQGARSIILELILLASTHSVAVVKPILPDVREFLRGTVALIEELLPLSCYGVKVPTLQVLVNCMDYTILSREVIEKLSAIIASGKYSSKATDIPISMLNTQIFDLEVYKRGHREGQPVHRLETQTNRKSLSAAQTMCALASELFPQWQERFDAVLAKSVSGVK